MALLDSTLQSLRVNHEFMIENEILSCNILLNRFDKYHNISNLPHRSRIKFNVLEENDNQWHMYRNTGGVGTCGFSLPKQDIRVFNLRSSLGSNCFI